MVFGPTTSGMACEGFPEATASPFTVMVAALLALVGVMLIKDMPFATLAV